MQNSSKKIIALLGPTNTGKTHDAIEKMLEFFSNLSEMKTTAIRHSNIYGPHDKYDFDRSHVFGATISKVILSDIVDFEQVIISSKYIEAVVV